MAHVREQVIDGIYSLLNASPTSWSLVWPTRFAPQRDVTPYVQVWVDDENVSPEDLRSSRVERRTMNVVTRGRVRTIEHEENEDRLDDMIAELETKLTTAALNTALSNKLRRLQLVSVDVGFAEDDDSRDFLEVTLSWLVEVFCVHGSPETLI